MKAYKKRYFSLFNNCITVKGINRSTICDLQKGEYYLISNKLYDTLETLKTNSFKTVFQSLPATERNDLDNVISKLLNANLGHFVDNLSSFPALNNDIVRPNFIEDCIIELSNINFKHFQRIITQLSELGCRTIEFRAYKIFSLNKLDSILKQCVNTSISNIEIYLRYHGNLNTFNINNLISKYPLISKFVIHSCSNSTLNLSSAIISYLPNKISSHNSCGVITPNNFVINTMFYSEGLKYNTCLYKKISINESGEITNCPSLKFKFGSIINNNLYTIITTKLFKQYWKITKDKIKTCKVCEFRRICSDCRAYVNNPYDKPIKCSYDPFTNTHH